jgi:toxin CcdB
LAQFDVYRLREGGTLVVDCQADWLSDFPTRVVVPLETPSRVGVPATRLNPAFSVMGDERILKTDLASAVRRELLGRVECSLSHERDRIVAAFDMLITAV